MELLTKLPEADPTPGSPHSARVSTELFNVAGGPGGGGGGAAAGLQHERHDSIGDGGAAQEQLNRLYSMLDEDGRKPVLKVFTEQVAGAHNDWGRCGWY